MNFRDWGLFQKMAVPVGLLLALGMLVASLTVPNFVRQNVIDSAVISAREVAAQFKTLRGYYTKNVVGSVVNHSDIKPSIEHSPDTATIPLPATMIHDLSALLGDRGTRLQLFSAYPFPNRASRELDDYQRAAWEYLSSDLGGVYVRETLDGNSDVVHVALADTMQNQTCVGCHNNHPQTPKSDWKVGDLRGVLAIEVDVSEQLALGAAFAQKLLLGCAVLIVAVMAALYLIYRLTLRRRLDAVSRALDEVIDGDAGLNAHLDIEGRDELGRMAQQFNAVVDRTSGLVGQICSNTQRVASGVEQMSTYSAEARDAVVRQQDVTTDVASAIEEIVQSAAEVLGNAGDAAAAAGETNDETGRGRQVVAQTVEGINELASAVQGAAAVIERLEQESESIGSVLDVIRGIAEQTNLLALNAAIEAARAGEQGRGFAVVADEVRTLASRTQDSTEEIQSMISRLQSGAQEAVVAMRRGTEQAAVSVSEAAKADASLENITRAVAAISDLNGRIRQAAEEQHSVAKRVSQSAHSISALADEAATRADRTAESGGSLNNEFHALLGLVNRISSREQSA